MKLDSFPLPPLLHCDLTQPILTLKSLGIEDVVNLALPSRPPLASLCAALDTLHELGAIVSTRAAGLPSCLSSLARAHR